MSVRPIQQASLLGRAHPEPRNRALTSRNTAALLYFALLQPAAAREVFDSGYVMRQPACATRTIERLNE